MTLPLCVMSSQDFMAIHNVLPFAILNMFYLFASSPKRCSTIHLHKLARWVLRYFSPSHLSLICPLSIKIFKPYFLMSCLRNINYLFLILIVSVLLVSISFKTSSLLTYLRPRYS